MTVTAAGVGAAVVGTVAGAVGPIAESYDQNGAVPTVSNLSVGAPQFGFEISGTAGRSSFTTNRMDIGYS